jgi:hypothetical protein
MTGGLTVLDSFAAGPFCPLFRGNRQVDAQGRGNKGGKARIGGKLRRELKMRRKKEEIET